MSAPENPGVWRARRSTSTLLSILMGRRCTPNTSLRSLRSGRSTCIWRSKRPARSNALSKTSTRLVAAKMITPLLEPKPSISVSNWFNVFSRSSLPPIAAALARARPTASISSMNTIQGAFSFAWRNKSRTREAPTPTNISTKSEPAKEKKGTLASPATAFASRVFPVPGGPTSKAPLGILPPKSVYFWGSFKNSTISSTSCLASASPATSLNVTLLASPLIILARLLPKFIILALPPPPACLVIISISATTTIRHIPNGRIVVIHTLSLLTSLTVYVIFLSSSFCCTETTSDTLRVSLLPSVNVIVSVPVGTSAF